MWQKGQTGQIGRHSFRDSHHIYPDSYDVCAFFKKRKSATEKPLIRFLTSLPACLCGGRAIFVISFFVTSIQSDYFIPDLL